MEKPMFKTVQEVLTDGDGLPERYIQKDSDGGALDAPLPKMDISVIDLGVVAGSPSAAAREELDKLRSALRSWGCFQVINHGIQSTLLDKLRQVTKQFFALPLQEKQRYARETGSMEGYGNDMILFDDQILDWSDRLFLSTFPEDRQKLKFWPEDPAEFRETLQEYTKKLDVITKQLLKGIAKSLGLDEGCFLEQYGEKATLTSRFNFYPPCPSPEKVLGVKAHADGSAITILLQDKEVGGLQFLKEDKWFSAPVGPDALLINAGDQLEIMSNGIFKSPVHRVVANSERERISVATFCMPDPDNEIGLAELLMNETWPRMYKTVKNYSTIFFQYYQAGRRPIEASRIESA